VGKGEVELTAKHVLGRKNIVRTAVAFMAEESRLASLAMFLLSWDIAVLILFPTEVFLS
jgi:hypothetical protein